MKNCVVLFDMDGALADFVGGALKAHGKTIPPREIEWDFYKHPVFNGMSPEQFWAPLANREFWANLDPLPDGMELFRRVADLVGKDRIGFLSSGLCPGSCDGKRDWIKRHLPGFENAAIFSTAKHLVAHPNAILIDDLEKNIKDFQLFGGNGVLIPRTWNRLSFLVDESGRFNVDDVEDNVSLHTGMRVIDCKFCDLANEPQEKLAA